MGTNTKMYKTIEDTTAFVSRLCELTGDIDRSAFELFVIPSYTTLQQANLHRNPALLKLGAQNMCWEEQGQFTGEISPLMLRETGCDLVMIGHSERRHIFGETDEMERKKVRCALDHDLTVLLCVGETEAEKDSGEADAVLERQLSIGLADIGAAETEKIWIAYEPVWAIGTGRTATSEQADEVCGVIRGVIAGLYSDAAADALTVQYGGSMNAKNAAELLAMPNVDGGLIGGASLKAPDFATIIAAAQ